MKTNSERAQAIRQKLRKERTKRRAIAIAVPLALCATLISVLFVPYSTGGAPDLARYRSSEYYPVITAISDMVYPEKVTKNNFERWGLGDWMLYGYGSKDMGAEAPTGSDPTQTTPDMLLQNADGLPSEPEGSDRDVYVETTPTQTAGVKEADLVKRSREKAFALCFGEEIALRCYSLRGEESALLGAFTILPEENVSFKGYAAECEMFLAEDLNSVTVLAPCYRSDLQAKFTAVITVDTKDAASMSVIGTYYVSGNYVTSRSVGDLLFLVSDHAVKWQPDFSKAEDFLPVYGTADDLRAMPIQNIILPEQTTRADYTVLASFRGGELVDCEALLSFSEDVYVSQTDFYVTNRFTRTEQLNPPDQAEPIDVTIPMTQITRIAFEGGMFEVEASVTVSGTVHDRYCMDAYDGYFRVFTDEAGHAANGPEGIYFERASASLHIFEKETLTPVSSVLRFAPDGETVQSARFAGDKAYVCTAEIVTLTDPVYVFDLSDPLEIASKDTGTIPGYSVSLTPFREDTLLGIGFGDDRGELKIEVYRESENAVESLAKYTLRADFSTQYKAHFIDPEAGLVGLMTVAQGRTEYLLLRFDGYGFAELAHIQAEGYPSDARAFEESGYLYIFCNTFFAATKI